MLVDPKHSPVSATGEPITGSSSSGMDFFNQKMEEMEMGQDVMMRKMGMLADTFSL